jgi:hypothetical protein
MLTGGMPVAAVLCLCGSYLAYCIRHEISVLEFVSAMTGVGMGLGLFTAIMTMYCAYGKRKMQREQSNNDDNSDDVPSPMTDIEMRTADVYANE